MSLPPSSLPSGFSTLISQYRHRTPVSTSSTAPQKRAASPSSSNLAPPPPAQRPRLSTPVGSANGQEQEGMDLELTEWQQDVMDGQEDADYRGEPSDFLGAHLAERAKEAVGAGMRDFRALAKAYSAVQTSVASLQKLMGEEGTPKALPKSFNALLKVPKPHFSELLTPATTVRDLEDSFRKELLAVCERNAKRYLGLRETELRSAEGRLSEASFFRRFHDAFKASLETAQQKSMVEWDLYHRALCYASARLYNLVQHERIALAEAATEKEEEASRKAAKASAARKGAASSTPEIQEKTVEQLIKSAVASQLKLALASFTPPSQPSQPNPKPHGKGKGGPKGPKGPKTSGGKVPSSDQNPKKTKGGPKAQTKGGAGKKK
ncbi:hypothetical protein JCM10207_007013 [Rhodosporidiobolus poonsookiae]